MNYQTDGGQAINEYCKAVKEDISDYLSSAKDLPFLRMRNMFIVQQQEVLWLLQHNNLVVISVP